MPFLDKVKDSIASRAAEGVTVSLTMLLGWAAIQVAPVVLPAIEATISKQVLLAILVASLVLNVIFVWVVWFTSKREPFRLRYGIYWDKDKNPHCPACKIPVAAYGQYRTGGTGYYCKPCKKVFALADASGKDIDPVTVLAEL